VISGTTATCSTTGLPTGTADVEAIYNGDTNFTFGFSSALRSSKPRPPHGHHFGSPASPTVVGTSVTFTATVRRSDRFSGLQLLNEWLDVHCDCIVRKPGRRRFVCNLHNLHTANCTTDVEAIYSGDTNFSGTTSAAYAYSVVAVSVVAAVAVVAVAAVVAAVAAAVVR